MGRKVYTPDEKQVVETIGRYEDTPDWFRAQRDRQSFRDRRLYLRRKQHPVPSAWDQPPPDLTKQAGGFFSDKKVGEVGFYEYVDLLKNMQEVKQKRSWSQDYARIRFDTEEPLCVLGIGDGHLGSWGTDYDAFCRITEEIVETPNLYIVILSDMEQMSIKLRNVLEISDNAIPPEWQLDMLDAWTDIVADKTIAALWDNHSVMREEAASGRSAYKRLMSRKFIYHNGIGHLDVTVGGETYKLAASHFFRGRSIENPVHGQMRYMRREGQDREIAMAGDSHVPGIAKYVDGATTRLAVNCGAFQTNSGYAKRFFSLATHPIMPCFTLAPTEHTFTPFWNVGEWVAAKSH